MAKTKPPAISADDIQRVRIEGKITKEEADLNEFRTRAMKHVEGMIANMNAEISARSGRIAAYKELLGLVPETDTSQDAKDAPEGPQEAPGSPDPAVPVEDPDPSGTPV